MRPYYTSAGRQEQVEVICHHRGHRWTSASLNLQTLSALGELATVAPDQRNQQGCGPISRYVPPRRRDTTEEPSKVKLVSPFRNSHLVSAEKRNRRSDAVDSGKIIQMALEVESQPLLGSPANCNHYVPSSQNVQSLDERPILYIGPIYWCFVHTLRRNFDALSLQPVQILSGTRRTGHNP